MKNFRLLNNIFGWVAFAVAAVTYLLTIEPSASFWDCGEFISSAYKLDVGHPPGAPFFMLTAKFFTLFASDPTQVAMMVNSFSAIASAFTILFLFWTITHLAQQVLGKSEEEYSAANIIGILAAGMVGALAYTFSDTFWFSAVEGEVYAYSSLFTAVVFWLILKWERVADHKGSDKWLILIAYLMGLSIGVHLLNLLAIPAIVLVYYFKNYKVNVKGSMLALLTSVVILGLVLYGLIPGFVVVASKFELLFVNTLGMSFNTGVYIYIIILVAAIIWSLYESYTEKHYLRMTVSYMLAVILAGIPFIGEKLLLGIVIIAALIFYFYKYKKKVNARWLNTSMAMIAVMLIGYSSYSIIMIRSAAQPTMDQSSPDNIFALKSYLNREQYGDRPLLYGAVFSAPLKLDVQGNTCVPIADKTPIYSPKPKTDPAEKDKYIVSGYKSDYEMDSRFMMLFPRMYSSDKSHVSYYTTNYVRNGRKISYDFCGQEKSDVMPTFGQNLRFFFDYQVNFMYWRYFMWNFSGRQNDIQSYGELEHGNWITGIPFIDNILIGDQTNLPTELKENKGHNVYFMLPLILGILGLFFLLNSGKKGNHTFWITGLLFVLTGLAIVVYLNQTPYQPRERDYAYAGSFYAFSIWIGLGVLGVIRLLDKFLPKRASAIIAAVACLGVPVLMAVQNWDDHDRSDRYTARDFGQNYLNSCKPNAIIFTNGDNDTFPLWYNQEVEGVRTDIRVCNLSYLQTDWYIDQMKRASYNSAPLPISWEPKDYISGKNEVLQVEDVLQGQSVDMKTAFDFIKSDDPNTKLEGDGFFPTKQLYLPVNADEIVKNGTVAADKKADIVPQMVFDLPSRVTKSEAMMLEMIKENNWKRPIYVAVTVAEEYYPSALPKYFERTGLVYHLVPVAQKAEGATNVNTNEMYENMMTKFKYGNIDNPKVYIDDNIMRMCRTHRAMFAYLVEALVNEGDNVRAKKALQYCEKVIPSTTVPHDYSSNMLAHYCYKLGMNKEGNKILDQVARTSVEYLTWYAGLSIAQQNNSSNAIGRNVAILNNVLQISQETKGREIFNKYLPIFETFANKYNTGQ